MNEKQQNGKWTIRESSIIFLVEEGIYGGALSMFRKYFKYQLDPRLLCAKIRCLLGTGAFVEALDLAKSAEEKDWDLPEILILKGKALYQLKEYQTAKLAFEKCDHIQPSIETKRWIQRCIVQISISDEFSRRIIKYEPKYSGPYINNLKHEFYQSQTQVTLVIYIKDIKENQVSVKYEPKRVEVIINTIPKMILQKNLTKGINPDGCLLKVYPKKIEIKMEKSVKGNWSSIEQL